MRLPVNQVLCGDAIAVMRARIPDDSIDLVITSPPYWGLRDYGVETVRVWGGSSECEHEWGSSILPAGHRSTEDRKSTTLTSDAISRRDKWQSSNICSKCEAWRGSLGLEPHPQMFIDHLIEICREIKRVLKPSGTFFLNLGDTYFGGKGKSANRWSEAHTDRDTLQRETWNLGRDKPQDIARQDGVWLQPKQKLMIPSRIAIALQHDGWVLRNDIIWHKPNHMPSSVKDRLSPAYEHIFLFVKNNKTIYWVDRFTGQLTASEPTQYYVHDKTGLKRFDRPKRGVDKDWFNEDGTRKFKYAWQGHDYYFDLDAIRKPHAASAIDRFVREKAKNLRSVNLANKWLESDEKDSMKGLHGKSYADMKYYENPLGKNPGDLWGVEEEKLTKHDIAVGRIGNFSYTDPLHTKEYHPQGKNPGDLWRISTQPFSGAHFAVFPSALIEPIIKAGSSRWVCSQCGKPRTRITETESTPTRPAFKSKFGEPEEDLRGPIARERRVATHQTVGWSDCGCGEKWIPGVVLDPFGGSGTVGKVSRRLGRRFILIEIVSEYTEMSEQRVRGKYKPIPEGVIPLTQFMEDEK